MVDVHSLSLSRITASAVAAFVLVASGCGYVKKDDFRSEVDLIRQEMRAGDAEVENRLSNRMDALEGRLSALEDELRALEDEFGAEIERLGQALRVHTPVTFGFDRAELDADQTPILERLGAVLVEHYPAALITVEGFTDPAGSRAYNQRLGMRRAETVAGYLTSRSGIPEGQVRSVSYGEDTSRLVRAGAQGPGEAGRANRRVVVVIDHPNAWEARATVATSGSN